MPPFSCLAQVHAAKTKGGTKFRQRRSMMVRPEGRKGSRVEGHPNADVGLADGGGRPVAVGDERGPHAGATRRLSGGILNQADAAIHEADEGLVGKGDLEPRGAR